MPLRSSLIQVSFIRPGTASTVTSTRTIFPTARRLRYPWNTHQAQRAGLRHKRALKALLGSRRRRHGLYSSHDAHALEGALIGKPPFASKADCNNMTKASFEACGALLYSVV